MKLVGRTRSQPTPAVVLHEQEKLNLRCSGFGKLRNEPRYVVLGRSGHINSKCCTCRARSPTYSTTSKADENPAPLRTQCSGVPPVIPPEGTGASTGLRASSRAPNLPELTKRRPRFKPTYDLSRGIYNVKLARY